LELPQFLFYFSVIIYVAVLFEERWEVQVFGLRMYVQATLGAASTPRIVIASPLPLSPIR
jgi:hypothetical protein